MITLFVLQLSRKMLFFSYTKEYRETILMSPCDVINDVITMKIFFNDLGWSFHFWCQIEAVFNILSFSKWPTFWGRDILFTGSDTGIWICKKYNHERLWHFELLIASLAQILKELFQYKKWLILGPYGVTNEVIYDSLLRRIHNLMIHMFTKFEDGSFVHSSVIMKNVIFSFIKEHRETTGVTLWRHRWRHHHENIFPVWFGIIFSFPMSNWSCI